MMNVHERAEKMKEILNTELIPLSMVKGRAYGEDDDAMANLRDFGSLGIVVRMTDKMARIKNFYQNPSPYPNEDVESIEDDIKDLINYAFYLLIYRRYYEGKTRETSDETNKSEVEPQAKKTDPFFSLGIRRQNP